MWRGSANAGKTAVRPRVVILSDFPPVDVIPGGAGYGPAGKRSDPDDVQSMVRFLLYANDLEVQGLVASCGDPGQRRGQAGHSGRSDALRSGR